MSADIPEMWTFLILKFQTAQMMYYGVISFETNKLPGIS